MPDNGSTVDASRVGSQVDFALSMLLRRTIPQFSVSC